MTETTTKDATGRSIGMGDTVGGTTSGRYQATIVGSIVSVGKSSVTVKVTKGASPGSSRPQAGDEVRISTDRVFLINNASTPATGTGTPDDITRRAAADTLTFDLDQLQCRAEKMAGQFAVFARDIACGCGPLVGEASRLAFAAAEILVQAAQVDAGRQKVKLLAAPSSAGGE